MSSNFPPSFVCTSNEPTGIQLETLCDSTTLTIEPAHFSTIDPTSIASIAKLVETKDQTWLRGQGGVDGLVSALRTHAENGIKDDSTDINNRRRDFGSNFYGEDKPAKKFHHFGLEALKHPMIIILLVCAVLSVCFGIKENGRREGWCEGVTKLVAILIAATISAVSNFLPHRLCHQLSEASSHIPQVHVVRSSQWQRISIPRIVVGDIVFLKPGDLVPADGLLLSGCSLQVKEGQTEGVVEVDGHDNPFLCCGSEVVDGYARMLVTAVGKNRWTQKIHLQGEMINQSQQLI
ncbi:unnamed protein product [Ilex paraguariensis]|uniref:Uncharacterized protein n=1 Tax=Ilex paraguariensis TaxID=185542 RepID=A0ABC8TDI3_9AQUA